MNTKGDNYKHSNTEEKHNNEKKILNNGKRKHGSKSDDEVNGVSVSDDPNNKYGVTTGDSIKEGLCISANDLPVYKVSEKRKKSNSIEHVVEIQNDEKDAKSFEEEELKHKIKRPKTQLGANDLNLESIKSLTTDNTLQESAIKGDVNQKSMNQNLQMFEKESPEFSSLIEDFKAKLTMVAEDDLQPVLELIKGIKLPKREASRLLLQLLHYKRMLKKMGPNCKKMINPQINKILAIVRSYLGKHKISEVNHGLKRKFEHENPLDDCSNTKKIQLSSALERFDGDHRDSSEDDEGYEGNDFLKQYVAARFMFTDDSDESGFSE